MISFDDKIWGLSILSWILIIIILVFFVCKVYYSNNSSYDDVDKENFQETNATIDGKEENVKVYNFNTSWCGWSVKFQPEWQKFQDKLNSTSDLSNISAFDIKCDKPENESMCKEYDVNGFPTVIIETNGKRGVYKGPRQSKDLIETVKDL